MHVIFDLDGTLIHSSDEKEIIARPHLDELLDFCFANFTSVSIWTAASSEWAERVCKEHLNGRNFRFVWTGNRCVNKWRSQGFYSEPVPISIKPLTKVWKDFEDMTKHNTIIVDDTIETYERNYGNAIHIPSFRGEENDNYLKLLVVYLTKFPELCQTDGGIRKVDKRCWHEDC